MEACKVMGVDFSNTKVVVQGFGNVGSVAAELSEEAGAKVIAVSDATGAIYNEKGLPIKELYQRYSGVEGGIRNYKECEEISNKDLLELQCDILMPSAIQGQITGENANNIRAKLIVEGANGPTTPDADQILNDKGIMVVPDILANAGGVVTSYFEWVQDLQNFFWEENQVNDRLSRVMRDAFAGVHSCQQKHKVDMRTAAMIIAVERVAHATTIRGIFP